MKPFRLGPSRAVILVSWTLLVPLIAGLAIWSAGPFFSAQTGRAQLTPPANSAVGEQLVYYNNVGIALLEQFNFKEAIAQFDRCLKLDPSFVPALVNSGLAHYYLQEYPQAEEIIKKALTFDPRQPTALFALGMLYRNRNEVESSTETFKRVLETDPEDSPTLYQLGQLSLRGQDYGQAERYFRKVIQLSPYDTAARYNLANTLTREGNTDEGRKAMLEFNRLREQGGITSTGTQYGEQGRYMMAIGEYPEIRRLFPQESTSAPPAGAPRVHFTDVTASAGIHFQHGAEIGPGTMGQPVPANQVSMDFAKKNWVSGMGSGGAFCDYDSDGVLDLFLANCSTDPAKARGVLLHADRPGHFEDVTEKAGIRAEGLGMEAYWDDFNNDGLPDLFLTYYGANQLYQNNGNGTFSDITAKAGLSCTKHWHLSAAVADVDHDGDLDIYVGNYVDLALAVPTAAVTLRFPDDFPGQGCHLYRNNGDGTFTDEAREAQVLDARAGITSVGFSDYDNRRDVDFWTESQGSGTHLYSNQRVGTFLDWPLESTGRLTGFSLAVGDYNKDGWMDLAILPRSGPPWLVRNLGSGKFDSETLKSNGEAATRQSPGWTVHFLDYDNDGDLDLFVLRGAFRSGEEPGGGPELWENQGDGKFTNVTSRVGLDAFKGKAYRSATFGDFDNDGDTDILLTVNGERPVLLRNDGGNENHWVKVRLQGTNSNRQGIGTKVEVKAGTLWQKVEIVGGSGYLSQSPAEVIFGLGSHPAVDALRLLWPGGVLQSEINLPVNQTRTIKELDRKGTSCPLLYTWNGSKYQFVTDFLGGCAIGYLEEPGRFSIPDTDEYVRIEDSQLRPREGLYSLKINNQLEEVLYVDQTELLVLDHPRQLHVYPNERLMPAPPYPEFKVIAARDEHPPRAAWGNQHQDVLPLISRVDRKYPMDFKLLPFKGYAEEHELVLDLGDLSEASNINLLMNAWIDYADSTANFSAAQAGRTLSPPYLQVKNQQGRWQTVLPEMGFPAGLPKTMVVDLTGKFLTRDYQVRIVTNMRIYWDQILVNTYAGPPSCHLYRLSPLKADLHYHGFPRETSPDGAKPFIYDYDWFEPVAPWKSHTGRYTRFGDVTPLLKGKEDMYVIMRNGDEIQLEFDAASLPPVPDGWARTFFFYADGFGKDMDLHSGAADTVAPLPFHRMKVYPYLSSQKYPDSDRFQRYQREFNTREVPAVVSRISGGF